MALQLQKTGFWINHFVYIKGEICSRGSCQTKMETFLFYGGTFLGPSLWRQNVIVRHRYSRWHSITNYCQKYSENAVLSCRKGNEPPVRPFRIAPVRPFRIVQNPADLYLFMYGPRPRGAE